jgi:hypothetical protein
MITAICSVIAGVLGVPAVVIPVLWQRRNLGRQTDYDARLDIEQTHRTQGWPPWAIESRPVGALRHIFSLTQGFASLALGYRISPLCGCLGRQRNNNRVTNRAANRWFF